MRRSRSTPLLCLTTLLAACGGGSGDTPLTSTGSSTTLLAERIVSNPAARGDYSNPSTPPQTPPSTGNPPAPVTTTISSITLQKTGAHYTDNAIATSAATPGSLCTAGGSSRPLAPAIQSTLLTNGGSDGFDCGLNVPTATVANPIGTSIVPGTTVTVKLGEAVLNERSLAGAAGGALVAPTAGIPIGDGDINQLGMTLRFTVDGAPPLTFTGRATVLESGPIGAAVPPAYLTACRTFASAQQLPAGEPDNCVDDTFEDFRVEFSGPQTVVVGANTFTVAIDPLSFRDSQSVVDIVARVSLAAVTPPPPPPPGDDDDDDKGHGQGHDKGHGKGHDKDHGKGHDKDRDKDDDRDKDKNKGKDRDNDRNDHSNNKGKGHRNDR